ncbi:MAG TPA: hypothetical protein VKY85_15745 [Candidatus Angelobacter sp.]|jgi:hypothetical protein|nr:hypothetical protein [Candidatus Angelobacter sp.]
MSNNQNLRVLCRQLARDLTAEELNNVNGGGGFSTAPTRDFTTTFCTAGIGAAFQDGDDD